MIRRFPNFFHEFQCLAGSCPRSCCIGWEVEIDDGTAAAYQSLTNPLGAELRACLQTDAEGALCFPLDGARCPFLDSENLCRIHRQLGQEYTSVTCREHPRFTEDFGTLQEISLSASCPEAARLLLADDAPLTFLDEPLPAAPHTEEEDPWLSPLLAVRNHSMTLLNRRTQPVRRRMAQVLVLAAQAQTLLDEDRAEDLPALCCGVPEIPPAPQDAPILFPGFLNKLAGLEILEADWLPLLKTTGKQGIRLPDEQLERLTAYFLFRWLLKSINDGDLLGRVQLSLASALTVEYLSARTASPEEALYRYCREIEHCQENIDALLDAFQWDASLLPDTFLRTLENTPLPSV